jgi:hypothetical protein
MLHVLNQISFADIASLIVIQMALAAVIILAAGTWRVYEKAGEPGWASLIPIYNVIILLRIADERWWCILLLLIPGINAVVHVLVSLDVARRFGKGTLFGVGLCCAGAVFYPILGFGPAQYRRPE